MKKVFFIVGSLGAGGSERVYWLMSQYFAQENYEVSVVFLDGNDRCFSLDVPGINFIDLKTVKASKSLFKLIGVLRKAKPFAVFSTTDHINVLTAIATFFVRVPRLIARVSNNPSQMANFNSAKARFYNRFNHLLLRRFDKIICQTQQMRAVTAALYNLPDEKLTVIPNPVSIPDHHPRDQNKIMATQHIVAVGRLSAEKGLFRLLDVMRLLPSNYRLNIAGEGPLMVPLIQYVSEHELTTRVTFLRKVLNVPDLLVQHKLLVMTSFTEGFPNVILEALAVGTPVVAFEVNGADVAIKPGFNGYIVKQDDIEGLRDCIIQACNRSWDHEAIKADVLDRFSLQHVGQMFEQLLN
ncbi:glycosyltransferase involved in cell wall biosynthesis [Mucilaginibacter yixingensis]|uniref:Glycosyltransferase involved in cell wall biosynthesis n=1 Tax=Mucilaginibacter yixingensis TaxID=1295612 RepID=A0A2T5J9D4_9SPHI|nr:glycosyltransferase [Mucilaginibacter yixingensis]PTQ96680.1 glycosyltransferase involved in cell wall biosynthesis [Mucilaginibacter yixingensis]